MRKRLICAPSLAIIALSLSPSWAGDLDPPGAPRSTPGPEPRTPISAETTPGDDTAFFIITRPGSYFLTGNVTNPLLGDDHDGIVITSSNVIIDLNGFTLDGFEGLTFPSDLQILAPPTTGILASGFLENITVRNGVVRDWSESGINLDSANGCIVEGIQAASNGGDGIAVGEDSVVSQCIARLNGSAGILADWDCTVSDCTATDNGSDGFRLANAVIRGCVAGSNDTDGISGNSILVTDCLSHFNGRDGIRVEFNSSVLDNVVHNNQQGAGIFVQGFNNRVQGNNAAVNAVGIQVSDNSNVIIQNTARANTTEYSIDPGNTVGQILSVADPITSTNPWANFEF